MAEPLLVPAAGVVAGTALVGIGMVEAPASGSETSGAAMMVEGTPSRSRVWGVGSGRGDGVAVMAALSPGLLGRTG